MEDNETEKEAEAEQEGVQGQSIVWVKLVSLWWPAKILRKIGELTEIELFDENKTKKTVENIKLRPFEKLQKIPTRRNKFWKAAYSLALEELG